MRFTLFATILCAITCISPWIHAQAVTVSMSDALLIDYNFDALVGPGETLRYTVQLVNPTDTGAATTTNLNLTGATGPSLSLVVGSVTTSQGTVTTGNTLGDTTVSILVGNLTDGSSATATFDVVVASPLTPGVTFVELQAVANHDGGMEVSDDPNTVAPLDATRTSVTYCGDGVLQSFLNEACEDGNFADGDGCSGICAVEPGYTCNGSGCKLICLTLDCNDGDPCTTDTCDIGVCSNTPNTSPCDDGDACTSNDACTGGNCSGQTLNCDDSNPCTDDSCNSGSGCVAVPNAANCDDGDACTDTDVCSAGVCAGVALDCDDGDACTADACVPGVGCANTPETGTACDDGDACTEADICDAGSCAGAAKDCDDGNACTTDSCAAGVCTSTAADGGQCSDEGACTTNDLCAGGICAGTPMVCDDDNVCTTDACQTDGSCAHDPADGGTCDDGDVCTESDACAAGVCMGSALSCDDGNSCTTDACDADLGCLNNAIDGCCAADVDCSFTGACLGGSCDAVTATCSVAPIQGCCTSDDECDDDDAGTVDVCDAAGTCVNKPPCTTQAACDDADHCTVDSCDLATGRCDNTPVDGQCCLDGMDCADGEQCVANACQESENPPPDSGDAGDVDVDAGPGEDAAGTPETTGNEDAGQDASVAEEPGLTVLSGGCRVGAENGSSSGLCLSRCYSAWGCWYVGANVYIDERERA